MVPAGAPPLRSLSHTVRFVRAPHRAPNGALSRVCARWRPDYLDNPSNASQAWNALAESARFDITPWAARVRLVDAAQVGVWELRCSTRSRLPRAVLIRPDGHVAWVGDLTHPGLPDALTTWFGTPSREFVRGHVPRNGSGSGPVVL